MYFALLFIFYSWDGGEKSEEIGRGYLVALDEGKRDRCFSDEGIRIPVHEGKHCSKRREQEQNASTIPRKRVLHLLTNS